MKIQLLILPSRCLFFILVLMLASWNILNSQVIYVDQNATGANNGSSWTDAYNDLQAAITVADAGNSIWVAQGTYYPTTNSTDRDASFELKNGVEIYGGFNGAETQLSQRDWVNNITTLSGDINQSSNLDGNSYTVVTGSGTDTTAVIDGFTITMGNANAMTGSDTSPGRSGGGIYNNSGSPTIVNCVISENLAMIYGGGMFNQNNSSPNITNCTFSENTAEFGPGGGIYNLNNSSPYITNSIFSENTSDFDSGGGMFNHDNCSPTITNSTFTGNTAVDKGGAIFNTFFSSPIITNSTFLGNTAHVGGGVHNDFESSPTISNSTFSGNTANYGGGMFNQDNCSPTITNSNFSGNSASQMGGGMMSENSSSPTIINSTITGNTAGVNGGGMNIVLGSSITIINSILSGNMAEGNGGGIYFSGEVFIGDFRIINCLLYDNSAGSTGGAIAYDDQIDGTFEIINSTFVNNSAIDGGGVLGITFWESGLIPPTFINCIAWDNSSTFGQTPANTGETVFSYSLIQDAGCPTGATCNSVIFNQDPLFEDTSANNFQLTSLSPVINKGKPDTSGLNLPPLDLSDNPRIFGDTVDMGPYEFIGDLVFTCCKQNTVFFLDSNGEAEVLPQDLLDSIPNCDFLNLSIQGEGSWTVDCSDFPGTTLWLILTDIEGNQDSCESVISIIDSIPPHVVCTDITVQLNSSGEAGITLIDIGLGTTDNCSVVLMDIDQDEFDCSNVGSPVTVTLIAEDQSGNTSNCSANVTIEDNTPPTALCQDVTVSLDATGNGSTTAVEVDDGSNDACGIQSLSLSQTDFDCGDVGTVVVTLTVEDNNGNTATCTANVTVLDQIDPGISCPADASILVPAGETEGFVSLDPATADDNCPGVDIANDYNADGADASDVYPVGVTTVTFTATDQGGNTAECQVQVTVTEDVISGGTFELSGHISTTFGVNINNVEMVMTGDEMQIEFTNPMGLYDFLVEGGNSVTITPEKNENWLDGVSTFDLVLIQRHIVFLDRFTNPYQIIAGDANDDGFVSTFDLVLLQNLIVGNFDTITGNTSWRFIPASYDFDDPENPLLESWPEEVTYSNVNSDLFDEDWVAMKTGDVSGDAGLSGMRRVAGNYSISAELMEKEDLENWVVQFSPSELIDLSGYQLEIQWDPNKVSFLDFDISNTDLTNLGEHHFFIDSEAGIVRTNWWHGAGQILDPKEELFRLEFEPLVEGLNPEIELKLAQRGSRWYSEAYRTADDGLLNLSLNWKQTTSSEAYALYPNTPNPYREYTQIRFELPRAEEVKLTIWDQGGALLKQVDIDGQKGMNEFLLRAITLPAGVLYYRIEAGEWEASNKMIRME